MWLDALVVMILVGFAVLGARRGALVAGFGVLSLAGAYSVAILAATQVGPLAATHFGLPPLAVSVGVGTLFFFTTYASVAGIGAWLARREPGEEEAGRSARDRFLGACFGCTRGAFVVLLVSLLAIWLDALRVTGVAASLPELGASRAAAVTETVVEAGVAAAFSDAGPGARVVARWAARPGTSASALQEVLASPAIADLQNDALFWTYVENGVIDAALNRGSFLSLSGDPEMRRRLADLGLIDEAAVSDPAAFRVIAGDMLRELGPRLRGLRDDSELQALVDDPQVAALVESGDTLALLGHAGFRRYVADVASR
jgi:uncharacterized membrane protein required for colicin V production